MIAVPMTTTATDSQQHAMMLDSQVSAVTMSQGQGYHQPAAAAGSKKRKYVGYFTLTHSVCLFC